MRGWACDTASLVQAHEHMARRLGHEYVDVVRRTISSYLMPQFSSTPAAWLEWKGRSPGLLAQSSAGWRRRPAASAAAAQTPGPLLWGHAVHRPYLQGLQCKAVW